MTTEVDRIEAQLRHLTLPSQRGYRRMLEARIDALRKGVVLAPEERCIVDALRHPGRPPAGAKGVWAKATEPWLYAAADAWNSRLADLDSWFVTGPRERPGFIKGPFSRQQIQRITAAGILEPVCCDDAGQVCAYRLAIKDARRVRDAQGMPSEGPKPKGSGASAPASPVPLGMRPEPIATTPETPK